MNTPKYTRLKRGVWVCNQSTHPFMMFFSWQRSLSLVLLLSFLLNLLLFAPVLLHAQATEPVLVISGVDTSKFPDIVATVYGENLQGNFADTALTLNEDGVKQNVTSSGVITVGVQTLLVLDAYAGINSKGLTGIPRKDEVVQAAQQLTSKGYLAANMDWLGFVSFDNSGTDAVAKVIEPWNKDDHNKVINSIVTYDTTKTKQKTPLSNLLFTAIRYFDDKTPPQNLQRSLVIFTDGFDFASIPNANDVIREARDRHVRIHTVQVGTSAANAQAFLQNLSFNTGGQFFSLTKENQGLDKLWQAIKATQRQRALTYRTTHATPQQISVQAATSTGGQVTATAPVNPPALKPPAVTIVKPEEANFEKKRSDGQPLEWNTALADLDQKPLDIGVTLTWPDGHERKLKQVEFIFGDKTVVQTADPFTAVTFPINTFDKGDYTIRVRATDELGLTGESAPKPFQIIVNRPTIDVNATATTQAAKAVSTTVALKQEQTNALATEEANRKAQETKANLALTEEATKREKVESDLNKAGQTVKQLTWASLASLVLGLCAILFAVYVWFNPRARKRATEIITGTIKAVTEPFIMDRSHRSAGNTVKARLTYIEGARSSVPHSLDLYGGTRIGRDPALSNTVIDDQRVSRFHCRITEEANGTFRIWDEGSTSGTYVNQEQVGMSGRILQPGDVINLGPVQYRFEPVMGSIAYPTEVYATEAYGTETQMYDAAQYSTTMYDQDQADEFGGSTTPTEGYNDSDINWDSGTTQSEDSQATKRN